MGETLPELTLLLPRLDATKENTGNSAKTTKAGTKIDPATRTKTSPEQTKGPGNAVETVIVGSSTLGVRTVIDAVMTPEERKEVLRLADDYAATLKTHDELCEEHKNVFETWQKLVTDGKRPPPLAAYTRTLLDAIGASTVDTQLLKDMAYKLSLNIGTSSVIQEGKFPKLSGFDYAFMPSFPANGQNLLGCIAFKSAILAAFAPVQPTPDVRQNLSAYEIATDPATGISFNYRRWGNPDADVSREVIECAYGYAAGEQAALKRLTSA